MGHDRDQLAGMAKLAKAAVGQEGLIALADRGYFEGYEILECERAGLAAVVPKPMTSNNLAEGLFDKRDFVYDAKNDRYQCPAGKIANYRFTAEEAVKTLHKYWSSDCPQCPMKPRYGLDGIEPLPDEDAAVRANRVELAGSGLQPQAGHQDPRCRAAVGGDEGIGRRPFTRNPTPCVIAAAADTADPEASSGAFSHGLDPWRTSFPATEPGRSGPSAPSLASSTFQSATHRDRPRAFAISP